MKQGKAFISGILATIVLGFIYYFFLLPPINIRSYEFWFFFAILIICFILVTYSSALTAKNASSMKAGNYMTAGIGICIAAIVLINTLNSPLLAASKYATRITIKEDGNFQADIPSVDFNALPLLDKNSSQKLGDRVMGQMPELVSQFLVSDIYTQINYNNDILRVTPLEYDGLIKYLSNRDEGVKGYITVNSVTGESNLKKLDKGMKYMPSALLFEDLDRHVRFRYPFDILGYKSFEIDNEGNPYWIISTETYSGVGLRKEVNGIIMVDPITGKTDKYALEDVPRWVDHVFEPSLIIEQVNDWGKYRGGFLNSMFGQKNVVQTTTGYNYTVMNDDVYLYTGITSAAADQANLGFILSNLRTKETTFYPVPGAEEYSAMASAEGQVQQMSYTASFPLLINLNNKATYLISLKDNAGLVKMYAFVDVADYQKVVVTDSSKGIQAAAQNYIGSDAVIDEDTITTKTIQIAVIKEASIEGNTFYYMSDMEGKQYRISIQANPLGLPFIAVNDTVEIRYLQEDDVTDLLSIKK